MPAEELKSRLYKEVEIKETSLKDQFFELAPEIEKQLVLHFNQKTFSFFEVRRPSKGLVHPVLTLEVQEFGDYNYHAVRFFQKNDEAFRSEEFFDRARFHGNRIKKLTKLGRFYPKIKLLDLETGIFVLQEFIFSSICDFDSEKSVRDLLRLIFKASEILILLDFNQNHFLYGNDQLHYVDKEYSEEYQSFEKAVNQNFNQATLFFYEHNYKYFTQVLLEYKESENTKAKKYFNVILDQLKDKKELLMARDQTPLIISRLAMYKEMIKDLVN